MFGPVTTRNITQYEPKSTSHSLAVDTTYSWSSIYRVSPAKTQQNTSFTDQLYVRPNIVVIRLATGRTRQTSLSQYNCICLFCLVASLKMTMFGRNMFDQTLSPLGWPQEGQDNHLYHNTTVFVFSALWPALR